MDQTIQRQLPGWTLEDAYGTVQDKRFQDELQKIHCEIKKLRDLLPTNPTKENVLQCLPIYEDAVEGITSLISFSYCASSADITDSAAAAAYAQTQALYAELESIASPLFAKLGSIADNDPFWENSIVSHWQFNAREKNKSWRQGLDSATNEIINKFAATSFYPVDAMYKRLNKSMRVQAQNSQGETVHLTHSQCVGLLKGADDPVLRETAQLAVNDWYKKQAGYYVDLLNLLHGFRKVQFSLAGLSDWMQPSLEQNRISKEALQAALGAIKHRQSEIQQAITMRAPFFGRKVMKACDFFAPMPSPSIKEAPYIPYEQAIQTVKASLQEVNPDIPAFIDMMLEKHWLDAKVDSKKAGGAFYSRFNRLKQPRVFTTYLGSFGSVLQQAHELGHAFHYWVMRDLPTNQTEFPMTLTEVASTFNEANVRRYCAQHAQNDEERLSILWQELISCANFCLQLPVRMGFETRFIEKRQTGLVSKEEAETMMQQAWHEYMGEAIEDSDPYLWCYKLHFYMTDQYIYNYAYTIGYLISQGLCLEQKKRGKDFPEFYRNFLRDTGRMTVDELISKHIGLDATKEDFWNLCLDQACGYIKEFKTLANSKI